MRVPSGDQLGTAGPPLTLVTCRLPLPSAAMTKICVQCPGPDDDL